jgi:hypothetical protein
MAVTIFWDLLLRSVLITDVLEELMPPSSRLNGKQSNSLICWA